MYCVIPIIAVFLVVIKAEFPFTTPHPEPPPFCDAESPAIDDPVNNNYEPGYGDYSPCGALCNFLEELHELVGSCPGYEPPLPSSCPEGQLCLPEGTGCTAPLNQCIPANIPTCELNEICAPPLATICEPEDECLLPGYQPCQLVDEQCAPNPATICDPDNTCLPPNAQPCQLDQQCAPDPATICEPDNACLQPGYQPCSTADSVCVNEAATCQLAGDCEDVPLCAVNDICIDPETVDYCHEDGFQCAHPDNPCSGYDECLDPHNTCSEGQLCVDPPIYHYDDPILPPYSIDKGETHCGDVDIHGHLDYYAHEIFHIYSFHIGYGKKKITVDGCQSSEYSAVHIFKAHGLVTFVPVDGASAHDGCDYGDGFKLEIELESGWYIIRFSGYHGYGDYRFDLTCKDVHAPAHRWA